jgi:hypothetical protein
LKSATRSVERRVRVGHPWELTLRQLIVRLARDYGILFEVISLPVPGTLLVRGSQVFSLPGIEEDDLLDVDALENICAYFHLPRTDFALDPDPDE